MYHDQLLRVRPDGEDTLDNSRALRSLKEIMKSRFEQLDIWITAYRIDII